MCGIAGKIDFDGAVEASTITAMCDRIVHRGPDERGIHHDGGVGLGAQRLAIIDVLHGHQPVFSEDRSIVAVLNGEIYNHVELREELRSRGHRFESHVDTEVLVHLYEERGPAMAEHLRGMYAFAVWDGKRQRLVLARDRVGKKPLFWARKGSRLWFGSEVRSLLADPEIEREPCHRAIASYLAFQYVPHPMSAFEGIEKLPPAHVLVADAQGQRSTRYWSLDYTRKLDLSERELEEEFLRQLRDAVKVRLMSEVPLGAFLSGGIDSSAVVAMMAELQSNPVKTFSIGFSEKAYDEVEYARMVAERFGTEHHEFVVEPKALDIMPRLALHYGEPYADPSAIPTFHLAELTKRHVTVALNGDGGDENFAGYRRYKSNDLASHFNWLPDPAKRLAPRFARLLGEGRRDNSTRSRVHRLARSLAMTPPRRYAMWMSAFDEHRRADLLTDDFLASIVGHDVEAPMEVAWNDGAADHRVDRMLHIDVETYLPADLLVKVDIATMAYSLEGRSPLLDHHLMEFAAAVPAHLKLSNMKGKRLMASALRGVIPDDVIDRPKMGFGVPLADWFRGELRTLPGEVLLDDHALGRGIYKRSSVERLIHEHQAGTGDHALRLWVLLQLEMWFRQVVEPAP